MFTIASLAPPTKYHYDIDDHLDTVTDPRGNVTTLDHNERGQLTLIKNPDADKSETNYIVGVALDIGIEPTVRHGVVRGYMLVEDACGYGDEQAAQRSLESLRFAGDAVMTDVETICKALSHH